MTWWDEGDNSRILFFIQRKILNAEKGIGARIFNDFADRIPLESIVNKNITSHSTHLLFYTSYAWLNLPGNFKISWLNSIRWCNRLRFFISRLVFFSLMWRGRYVHTFPLFYVMNRAIHAVPYADRLCPFKGVGLIDWTNKMWCLNRRVSDYERLDRTI